MSSGDDRPEQRRTVLIPSAKGEKSAPQVEDVFFKGGTEPSAPAPLAESSSPENPSVTPCDPTAEWDAPTVTSWIPQGPAPSAAGSGLREGEVLNNTYRIVRMVDGGGMGLVYEAVELETNRKVAVKVILPQLASDPKVQALLKKEAEILSRLSHA